MGWTGLHKDSSITPREFLRKTFTEDSENARWEVLKDFTKAGVYYAAVRVTRKQTGEVKVFAVVTLYKSYPRSWENFMYKDMDETVHPFAYDCPESILSMLDEPYNDSAKEWRKLCRLNNSKPSNKIAVGSKIKFEKDLDFGRFKANLFIKESTYKYTAITAQGLIRVRFRRDTLKNYKHEIVK